MDSSPKKLRNSSTGRRDSVREFVSRYYTALTELAQAVSSGAQEHLPDCLRDTSFVLACLDDRNRTAIELQSRVAYTRIMVNGSLIAARDGEPTFLLARSRSVEAFLFPQAVEHSQPGFLVQSPYTVLSHLAFSNAEFARKHWSEAKFARIVCDLPFSVGPNGTIQGIDILYGFESNGKANQRLIEYVLIFGERRLIPSTLDAVRDLAFHGFVAATSEIKQQQPDWSFTGFLRGLEGAIENNVLILGPYSETAALEGLKQELRTLGYSGFLLKDAPDLEVQTNLEKHIAAVMCARFVIVVDTKPSGHIAEIVELLRLQLRPVIVLRDETGPSTAMLDDSIQTDPYFRTVILSETGIGAKDLVPHIGWANDKLAQKIDSLNRINTWR